MSKILLVEDNELNRDMLSRRLLRKGYDVLIAKDGAEGAAIATSERPDLILMDMSLPVLDGWEATRRLKAAPETRSIPVIALTAHAMASDRGGGGGVGGAPGGGGGGRGGGAGGGGGSRPRLSHVRQELLAPVNAIA